MWDARFVNRNNLKEKKTHWLKANMIFSLSFIKIKNKSCQEATGMVGAGREEVEGARDGDYDNTAATAVRLWRAAVSTEGDEAGARTGDSVTTTMTAVFARTEAEKRAAACRYRLKHR